MTSTKMCRKIDKRTSRISAEAGRKAENLLGKRLELQKGLYIWLIMSSESMYKKKHDEPGARREHGYS